MRKLRKGFCAVEIVRKVQSRCVLWAGVPGRSLQTAQGKMSSYRFQERLRFRDDNKRNVLFSLGCLQTLAYYCNPTPSSSSLGVPTSSLITDSAPPAFSRAPEPDATMANATPNTRHIANLGARTRTHEQRSQRDA